VEDSKSWILEDYPVNPPLQCCAKSHIDVMDWYVKNSLADYLLVLEDDAAILRDGFSKSLESTIELWNDEIDYVSIGYLPDNVQTLLPTLKCDSTKTLYWGFKDISKTIWGTRSYIVKRSVAFDMSHIMQRDKCIHVKNTMDCFVKEGRRIANKVPYVQADVIFPLLFRQAICYPLLVIETQSVSTISNKVDRLWAEYEKQDVLKLADYYKAT
jgi:GR25 family glycosyltransferase involved in LPS biosynthesis